MGSQVVSTWCILRVSLVSVLPALWLFKAAEIALFFPHELISLFRQATSFLNPR